MTDVSQLDDESPEWLAELHKIDHHARFPPLPPRSHEGHPTKEESADPRWYCRFCGHGPLNDGNVTWLCQRCFGMTRVEYMPTPSQIAATAAKIRKSWSEGEHRVRAGLSRRKAPYEFPNVKCCIGAEDVGGTESHDVSKYTYDDALKSYDDRYERLVKSGQRQKNSNHKGHKAE